MCVLIIANIIGVTVANASHLYRRSIKGLLSFEGKLAFYSLDDEHIRQIMMIALAFKKRGEDQCLSGKPKQFEEEVSLSCSSLLNNCAAILKIMLKNFPVFRMRK